ncbi:MAG: hypothetical protein RR448_00600 [Niameybacter sp.]
MYPLKHAFVKYEGICDYTPKILDNFINLSTSFTVSIPYKTWPIYTLHKVTITTRPLALGDESMLSLPLTLIYQYTIKDLCHTMHTTTYSHIMHEELSAISSLSIRKVYVENLFAYCLDDCHIYTAISLFVTL